MVFAISDIHGHYEQLMDILSQNNIYDHLKNGSKLVFLGDYIDRGPQSFQVLSYLYELQKEWGTEKIIVLKGNHEGWFLDFLFEGEDIWLTEDVGLVTSRTFLDEQTRERVQRFKNEKIEFIYDLIRDEILKQQGHIIQWLKKLPLYYETQNSIFVHAGVDEEAGEWWNIGTDDYTFLNKYPPTKGCFNKMIIAGHVSAKSVSGDCQWIGPYFDGQSHIYIDNSVSSSKELILLAVDDDKKAYYQMCNGIQKKLKQGEGFK